MVSNVNSKGGGGGAKKIASFKTVPSHLRFETHPGRLYQVHLKPRWPPVRVGARSRRSFGTKGDNEQFTRLNIAVRRLRFRSPLVASAIGRRCVSLQPTPKHPAARGRIISRDNVNYNFHTPYLQDMRYSKVEESSPKVPGKQIRKIRPGSNVFFMR